jgi:hypothetical protein
MPERPSTTRVTLDLARTTDHITGSLDDGRGPRRFYGWLELSALLDQVREATPPNDGGSAPTVGQSD